MSGKLVYHRAGNYTGWLGNLIWQISGCIGIARKNGLEPVFVEDGYYSKDFYSLFKGKFPVMPKSEIAKLDLHTIQIPDEQCCEYVDIKLDADKNYNLEGYFQTRKYFANCEDEVKQLFEFSDDIKKRVDEKCISWGWVAPSQWGYDRINNMIAIHVRRGDYVSQPEYHPVLPIEYYVEGAKRLSNENSTFLVFSDDIEWCKENFTNHIFKGRIYFSEGLSPAEDMFLMTCCKDFILSNSTFSWWGAYLSQSPEKRIVAPTKDKWFGSALKHWKIDDLYEPNWILI